MDDLNTKDSRETFTNELFDSLREGFLVLDTEYRVKRANTAFCELFKVEADDLTGLSLFELGDGQWDIPELRRLLKQILPRDKSIKDYYVENDFQGIGNRVIYLNARQIDNLQLILMAFEDATERVKAKREVSKSKDELELRVIKRTGQVRKLAKQITEIEQQERERISQLLHDDLQQILFSVRLNLNIIERSAAGEKDSALADKISEVTEMVMNAIDKTRQLSYDLNPPVLKFEKISRILEWIVKRYDEMYGLQVTVKTETDFFIRDDKVRTIILKIVRELLFNIVKHTDTDTALIEVIKSKDNSLVIRVIDEGTGFDLEKIATGKGTGLFSIQERMQLLGGSFDVDVAPGRGSRIEIKLPVSDDVIPDRGD